MGGYYIKRTNVTADRDVAIIGKRFKCGPDARPYDTARLAKAAAARQEKQDREYCPDCVIIYDIIPAKDTDVKANNCINAIRDDFGEP